MEKIKVQPGSKQADKKFRIEVSSDGPYMVFGSPSLDIEVITTDAEGQNWEFARGENFDMDQEPVALCRCGESKNKPYCDGAHFEAAWDPRITARREQLLDGAQTFEGPDMSLTDNENYCVFARFCDAKGRVWNLVSETDNPTKRDYMVHEANMCPGGRLSAWDNSTEQPIEPHYDPSLALIQDKPLAVSGGLWVRGGIPVQNEHGDTYEIRNRVVLCRCGQSSNKPFCNGAHASIRFRDGLPMTHEK